MGRKRYEHLLTKIGVLRHPCDLDLLVFFHRHPNALLTSERLASYTGYDLNQVGRSLDLLTESGLLERSQNPTHAARLYVLKTPEIGWLGSLLDIGSTPEGRRELIEAMRQVGLAESSEDDPANGAVTSHRWMKRIAAR